MTVVAPAPLSTRARPLPSMATHVQDQYPEDNPACEDGDVHQPARIEAVQTERICAISKFFIVRGYEETDWDNTAFVETRLPVALYTMDNKALYTGDKATIQWCLDRHISYVRIIIGRPDLREGFEDQYIEKPEAPLSRD